MPCLLWMSHFFAILEKEAPVEVRLFEKISADDAHNIQTHVVNMDLLVSDIILFVNQSSNIKKMKI